MRIISLDKEILAKRLSAKSGQDLGGVCFFLLNAKYNCFLA